MDISRKLCFENPQKVLVIFLEMAQEDLSWIVKDEFNLFYKNFKEDILLSWKDTEEYLEEARESVRTVSKVQLRKVGLIGNPLYLKLRIYMLGREKVDNQSIEHDSEIKKLRFKSKILFLLDAMNKIFGSLSAIPGVVGVEPAKEFKEALEWLIKRKYART